jgi:hypothetical protein
MGVLSSLADELDSDKDDTVWLQKVDALERRSQLLRDEPETQPKVNLSLVRRLATNKSRLIQRYTHVTIK